MPDQFNNVPATTNMDPHFEPGDLWTDLGVLAMSPVGINAAAPTSQTVLGWGFHLYANQVITNISVFVSTAASGTTPTKIKLGLWDSVTPTCLAVTADLSADSRWTTTGAKVCALSSPYTITSTGMYYAAFLINGTFGTTNVQLVQSGANAFAGAPVSSKRLFGSLKTSATDMNAADTGTIGGAGGVPQFALS